MISSLPVIVSLLLMSLLLFAAKTNGWEQCSVWNKKPRWCLAWRRVYVMRTKTRTAFLLASERHLGHCEQSRRLTCPREAGTNTAGEALMFGDKQNTPDIDFESLVNRYYQPLYQFAFSLTHREAEAGDLTQQTFLVWATKGHQLRDPSKVKTWLFTTLHREFLKTRRRQSRFPHQELH